MLCWEKSSTFCAQSIDIDPSLTGKGRKTRIVPLLKETSSILKKYIHVYKLDEISKQDTPLFFNVRGEKLTRQGITYILQKYADSANIESISPHVIRHSKAMHLTDADINPIYIPAKTGIHVSGSTDTCDTRKKNKPTNSTLSSVC